MKDDSGHSPILQLDAGNPQPALMKVAAMALQAGRSLVFPTDTVYGLGLLVTKTANPNSIFRIKQRPLEKSLPLLVASLDDLQHLGTRLPAYAQELAAKYWPGALTLVVKASSALPRQFVAVDGSVALRMPNSTIALALIAAAGGPLATSSANISGQKPATEVGELNPLLATSAALVIDGGTLPGGQASTVVSCLGAKPVLLRSGPVEVALSLSGEVER